MKTINIFIGAVILSTMNLHAEQVTKPLNELDALVGRWMDLRAAIADEKQSWKDQQEHLKSEISLLESESESLKKEIAEGDSFALRIEKEHSDAQRRKNSLQGELDHLGKVISEAETVLLSWRKRIPSSLCEPLNAAFDSLPTDKTPGDSMALTKRAQNIAALFSQIETLQNRFHATSEMLEVKGVRRKVDILFVGLTIAFAASPADDWAARGRPTEAGWIWETDTVDAQAVRLAINIYNRRENAQLVSLPVSISKGEQK